MSETYVKVMRSYDYCHFEVCLSLHPDATLDEVNQRRKEAALLVDEAVRQYKLAKEAERKREMKDWEIQKVLDQIECIKKIPESEWTAEQAALMRGAADEEFWKAYREDDYYYFDEWRDHHFSMLRRFQDATVRAG